MGMTIEEIIQELERTKDYPASDPASDEALDGAIGIIHKYQKIKEMLDDWEDSGEEDDPINIIDNIEEVLENGNDN